MSEHGTPYQGQNERTDMPHLRISRRGDRRSNDARPRGRLAAPLTASVLLVLISSSALGDAAKGTVSYKSKTGTIVVTVQHVYLVKGPDDMTGKPIRRIVLSSVDVGAKLRECASMRCSDGGIGEGMTIDLDAGPRLNYWFVGNGQLVQYSGTADPASLQLSTNTPQRVAGKWNLDESASGGPRIDVEFDATLLKEVSKAR